MNIQRKIITNYRSQWTSGRNNNPVEHIVFHTFDGVGDDLFNWFNNISPKTSAHFSVQFDGSVKQYIELADTAHHAGHEWMNYRSIGIEHQDNGNSNDIARTDALYESSAQLVAWLWEQYPTIPKNNRAFNMTHREAFIKGHGYAPSFTCSGGLNVDRIVKRAWEIYQTNNQPAPAADNLYRVYKQGKQLNAYKVKQNALNYYIDNNCDKVVHNNLDITKEFVEQKNVLESKIEELNKAILSLEGNIVAKESEIATLKEQVLTCENAKSALQEKLDYVSTKKTLLDIIKKLYERFFKKN